MKQGNAAALVLRIIGLAESTYYERLKRLKQSPEVSDAVRRGRHCPGYSLTLQGRMVSDEQIKEWLLELVEGEEHIYGYKLLAQYLRNEHGLILGKANSYRLCKELDILQRKRKSKHPRRLAYIESFHSLMERDLMNKETLETGGCLYRHRPAHGFLQQTQNAWGLES